MHTKLTLRLDRSTIGRAKRSARRRGKSLSRMVEDFFVHLDAPLKAEEPLPPIVCSLKGCLRKAGTDLSRYRSYLEEKYR